MGRPPGGLAGCICTVSGHDFSGAEKQYRVWALAPGRALRQLHRLQWLKPSFFYELSARLKPCPDTIHRLEREKSGLARWLRLHTNPARRSTPPARRE